MGFLFLENLPPQRLQKIQRDWSFLGKFGKGCSRQASTPAQRLVKRYRCWFFQHTAHMHTQGKNQEDHLSAGFQQVQHQQDARSKLQGSKLQGNSGIINCQRQFWAAAFKYSSWRKEFRRVCDRRALLITNLVPGLHAGICYSPLCRAVCPCTQTWVCVPLRSNHLAAPC